MASTNFCSQDLIPDSRILFKKSKRYSSAVKHLLPLRKEKRNNKHIKIDEAGFFSLITFSWMSAYIYKAYKKGLAIEDIPLCSPLDSCDLNAQRLERLWQDEMNNQGPQKASFGKAIWKFVRTRVLICSLIFSFSCLMGFLGPTIFMKNLLEYLEEPNENLIKGFTWALALTGAEILRTMFFALYYSLSYRTALRLRSACVALVYKKLLNLNFASNARASQVINLYSFDGPRLYYMIVFGPMAIGGPIIFIFAFFNIYYILGPWALIGMIIFILYYPLQFLLAKLTGYFRLQAVKKSEKRIKLIIEILSGIKVIKMYAWEKWFFAQIQDVRKKELKDIKKIAYCQSIGISLAPTIPIICAIVTFLIHVKSGGNLTSAQAFSVLLFLTKQMKTSVQVIRDGSMAFTEGLVSVQRFKVYTILVILHTQLRTALNNTRFASDNIIQGRIVCNRYQDFLMFEENSVKLSPQLDGSIALCIKDGCFCWEGAFHVESKPSNRKKEAAAENLIENKPTCTPAISCINVAIPKGALIGVCGPVGAGKSSFLLACLGQLKMTSGQISRTGSCAYVTQQSWIENASLKENILFGHKFDSEKYAYVLDVCVLNEDINKMPDGDETEIGERGVNLSGGQKQRISLARALYSDRDIYFLDDPLSAVDSNVGIQIFEKYIVKSLRDKTVILVTSQIQFLRECDEIFFMKEGRIFDRGAFWELSKDVNLFGCLMPFKSSGPFSNLDKNDKEGTNENDQARESKSSSGSCENEKLSSPKNAAKKLTEAEEQIRGTIKASTYRAYVMAAGGCTVCFFVVLCILLNVGSNVLSSWWLAMWIKEGSGNTSAVDPVSNKTVISQNINDNPKISFFMTVYASTIGVIVVTCIIRGFVYTRVTARASKVLHEKLFQKVLFSPMKYFDGTPVGRIQNLFSRDFDEIDSRLPESVETMLQNIWAVTFSFLSIVLVFQWFLIPLALLGCLYFFISKIFRVAVRDLKRMESISRGPVFGHISATVEGLPVIHAFNKGDDYVRKFCRLFNESSTIFYLSNNAMRWMAVRLDFLSVIISFVTSFSVVLLKGKVASAYAGIALTYAAQICGVFQYTIRLMSENEARFVSVERIQNSIEKLKGEDNLKDASASLADDWPSKGRVQFENVTLSYGSDLPPVLHDISFSVSGGEKIGIVGRTGAGKSSLLAALFRLVELSSGSIRIDGADISRIPLSVLRSRLSVIPQDPTLFNESLRLNLDPLDSRDESVLWEALKKTKLFEKVYSMPEKMSTRVGENENLSVGEKQLVCLARALLRGSKILVLDEATASIDPDTEADVQTTIQREFADCTVITIAHRLSTVRNCDRILVMDGGRVLEFDEPDVLMKNIHSRFYKMMEASELN